MEFLADMVTNVPEGTSVETVEDTRRREAVRARELTEQGHLRRLWRPPAKEGEWRTWGIYAAADEKELQEILSSLPLHVWMTVTVTPLTAHPNDPGLGRPNG